jgi:type IV secretion system protein VirB6
VDSWHFFGFIFTTISTLFTGTVQTAVGSIIAYMHTPLILGTTVWLAGSFAQELLSVHHSNPFPVILRRIIRAGLVLALASAAAYVPLFATFMMTEWPNEITLKIASAFGQAGVMAVDAFDKLLGGSWVMLVQIWNNTPTFSPKGYAIALIAGIEFIIDAIFIAIAFLIYLSTYVMLGLTIVFGPFCVCALLWEKSVFIFNGWISTVLGLITTQALVVCLLTILMITETTLLNQMTQANGSTGVNVNDPLAQLHYLIEAMLLYFLVGYLAPKMPQLARSIIGAGAPGIEAMSGAMHGALATGVSMATRAGIGGAASAAASIGARMSRGVGGGGTSVSPIGMRSITPAGRAP